MLIIPNINNNSIKDALGGVKNILGGVKNALGGVKFGVDGIKFKFDVTINCFYKPNLF